MDFHSVNDKIQNTPKIASKAERVIKKIAAFLKPDPPESYL